MKYALVVLEKEGGEPIHNFMKKLRSIEGVLDAYVVYGRFDIVAFIEGKDDTSLKKKVSDISRLKGILWVETYIDAT